MDGTSAGMTLLELLVAFFAFVLLIGALVSMATTVLDMWTEGENLKDVYDRAQAILDTVAEDVRNVYFENEWHGSTRRTMLIPPGLYCDFDANLRPRLRLTRTGRPAEMQLDPERALDPRIPGVLYTDAWEIAYVMHEKADKNVLYRGARYFDRQEEDSLFDDDVVSRQSDPRFSHLFVPIDDGVLYLGFEFWTQFTRSWDENRGVSRGARSMTGGGGGSSLVWDSSRTRIPGFAYHRGRVDARNPDFVLPEIVQVSLTLESTAQDTRGVELVDPVEPGTTTIRVSNTRGMPMGPGFIKIGSEWMQYDEQPGHSEIRISRRAVRGTKAATHQPGARVRFGPTFVAEVYIPVYREMENP